MTTAATVIAEVRDLLDEPTAAQWTDVMLRRWINEGLRDMGRATRHMKATVTLTVIGGQGTYAMPANTISIEHAWYHDVPGTRHIPLQARHMENMDEVRGQNWDREGTPAYYTTQGFSPTLVVTVFPTPTVDDDEIVMIVSRLPATIATDGSDDADALEIPTAWYDALADYCEFKALRRDRDPRWQEAFQMYSEKRDGLVNNNDYLAVNREMIADPRSGYLPAWLVEFD